MNRTHNEAINTLRTGNEELAWVIAQQDEGMLPGVTREQWVKFAEQCITNQDATDRAYEESY